MTTYNTGNPVGSVDVRDLYDNAENLDKFTNGPLDAYPDRFGVSRQSWAGLEAEFDADQVDRAAQWAAFLLASGYQVLGPYGAGLVFTAPNQVFSYLGEFYAPGPAITLPYTTTGVGAAEIANFRSVGDAVLRSDLSDESSPSKGAALVGRGFTVVDSIAELRGQLKTSPSKYVEVAGQALLGDNGGGTFYLDTSDTTSADNGMSVIVATDGGRWKPISNDYPILPLTQTAYNITNVGFRLKLPTDNLLKNPSFYIWHDTGIAPMATSIAENTNAITQAQWRMEAVGSGTTITGIQRITSPEGGLRFTANFGASTGYAYVRQNVLGVRQFSNKTLTTCVDIEVDAACSINFYMLLRFNALNDAGNRPLIVDSTPLALTAGRHKIALSMTTPDVDLSAIVPNLQESLEYTIRVLGASSSVTVRIYGASLTPGREVFAPRSTDPLRDREDADTRYEAGRFALVGLSNASGQKRLYVPYRSTKYAPPGALTYADIAGNLSKVSTYDVAGVRTDNVTPTVVAPMNEGFEVILNASTAAGIGVQYVNNTYF